MADVDATQTGERVDSDIHPTVTSDEDNIKKQVETINKLAQEGGEKKEEIGENVLIHNFHNDTKAASSRDPRKMHSYRKLVEHSDLEVSASTLNRCVRIAIQSRFIKENGEAPSDLSYSQKFMLLALRNDLAKVELVKKIVAESLSRPQVEALINEKRRRPKPKPEENPESKIDIVVRNFQALREIDINHVMGEIDNDKSACNNLREEAVRVAEWVTGLIRGIEGYCVTGDTVEVGNG